MTTPMPSREELLLVDRMRSHPTGIPSIRALFDEAVIEIERLSRLAQAALSVDNLHPVTSTLRKMEADLRACAVVLGQDDELRAVLIGYADAAKLSLTSPDGGKAKP